MGNPPIPTLPKGAAVRSRTVIPAPRSSPGLVVSTIKYLMRTEVHTFAFSVAANSILSFFPFVVLLMTLIRRVFHCRVMYDVVLQLLRDYLPAGQDFVIRNLNAMVNSRQRVQVFFLIYWLLPNGKVPARAVLPAAIIMGLLSEALKYAYILALPWLNFQEVYGPFALSVSMMFWAFLSGLLLLAGANLSAEEHLLSELPSR